MWAVASFTAFIISLPYRDVNGKFQKRYGLCGGFRRIPMVEIRARIKQGLQMRNMKQVELADKTGICRIRIRLLELRLNSVLMLLVHKSNRKLKHIGIKLMTLLTAELLLDINCLTVLLKK